MNLQKRKAGSVVDAGARENVCDHIIDCRLAERGRE